MTPMIKVIAPSGDLSKLKEAILVVSKYCEDKFHFGAIHLNKILFWADFRHFKKTGKSITETVYWKLERGPVPKYVKTAEAELMVEGRFEEVEKPLSPPLKQKRPTAKGNINESLFTEYALQLLRETAETETRYSASEVEKRSYILPIRLAQLREEIPLYVIHTTEINQPTQSSQDWVREIVSQYKIA